MSRSPVAAASMASDGAGRLTQVRDRLRAALQGRPAAMALVILVHLLVLLLLLRLAPDLPFSESKGVSTSVELLPEEGTEQTRSTEQRKDDRPAGGGAQEVRPAPQPEPPEEPPQEEPAPPVPKVEYMRLTDAELRSLDGTLATRTGKAAAPASSGAGPAELAGAGAAAGGGGGPNGERLYPADWQRKPTRAELGFYLPAGMSGYGMVACRTAHNFRVEDCREIGQSPQGSGLARAVREAAWQFRVLPPRVGGKPMIGVWVQIRIDYIKGEVRVAD